MKFKHRIHTILLSSLGLVGMHQLDVSANFLYVDRFTFGVAYRWGAAVSGLVGFQITDGIMIGYSYDADTMKLANHNSGSHEIFLRFTLTKNTK